MAMVRRQLSSGLVYGLMPVTSAGIRAGCDCRAAEKKEMHDFGKAATLLSILKSKARRTLGIKLKTRTRRQVILTRPVSDLAS
jgi:hypothetical protein